MGEIATAQVARAAVATRAAVKASQPFKVTIGGLGAFPSLERPQVVWLGSLQGAEELERLAAALNTALAQEHFPADPRRFRPHLTLGRSRDDRQWGDLVRALQQHRHAVVGDQLVEVVTVMESRLTPDGPVYTPWEQVRLGHGLNSSQA
jgi:2'-5' RNA ligase